MDDLKPCPFCGRKAVLERDTPGPRVHISCSSEYEGECDVGPGVTGDTKAEAITAWNTRAPSPEAAAEIERLRVICGKLLANLDALDDYMKQPERGGYGVECAVCMNEWLEPEDRAVMEAARQALSHKQGDRG